mmetsp:Transcript_46385/g.110478  ORF Transcript_46385/g.110478 Transcript_46385/m.110478 type:complete len:82 (+) Transcript_46385:55-300(+)
MVPVPRKGGIAKIYRPGPAHENAPGGFLEVTAGQQVKILHLGNERDGNKSYVYACSLEDNYVRGWLHICTIVPQLQESPDN